MLTSSESQESTPADPLADALRRAATGDQAAFGEFYDQTAALVFGISLKILRNRALAEEVSQEVFLELWKLAPRYDRSKGSAKSWTATIAHRRAVDRVRSEGSRRRREESELSQEQDAIDLVSSAMEHRLEQDRIASALQKLSDVQRQAVTMAYFGGLTYREVAHLLQIPEGTIKTRIRDGLTSLRIQLQKLS